MTPRALCMAVLVAATSAAGGADAQAPTPTDTVQDGFSLVLGVKAGVSRPQGGGDVFGILAQELELKPSDFDAGHVTLEVAARFGDRVDLVAGLALRSPTDRVTRAWADREGMAGAEQTTRLAVEPGVHLGARVFPLRPDASPALRPYLSAGAGRGRYTLEQHGTFADHTTGEALTARFIDSSTFTRVTLGAGVEMPLSGGVAAVLEVRRESGSVQPGGDFRRLRRFDLSRTALSAGASWSW